MISTPVAVVRGLLIGIGVWGIGAAGSHAFSACVGALGVCLAGTALTKASVRQPADERHLDDPGDDRAERGVQLPPGGLRWFNEVIKPGYAALGAGTG